VIGGVGRDKLPGQKMRVADSAQQVGEAPLVTDQNIPPARATSDGGEDERQAEFAREVGIGGRQQPGRQVPAGRDGHPGLGEPHVLEQPSRCADALRIHRIHALMAQIGGYRVEQRSRRVRKRRDLHECEICEVAAGNSLMKANRAGLDRECQLVDAAKYHLELVSGKLVLGPGQFRPV
jgi:hypothetical protein